MSTIEKTFVDGRESHRVTCPCGWVSASLWADTYSTVIELWAEQEAASHGDGVTLTVKGRAEQIRKLEGEIYLLDAAREDLARRLAAVRKVGDDSLPEPIDFEALT